VADETPVTRAIRPRRRVLLIGPLPPTVGGDTRLFSFLAADLPAIPGFEVQVIDSSRGRQSNSTLDNLAVLLKVLFEVLINAPRADVISLHASDRGMVAAGPILYAIARLSGSRYICRLFGGSFDEYYRAANRLIQSVIRGTILSSDVCLFETRRLVDYFAPIASGRVEWFSNYTRLLESADAAQPQSESHRCERLIFLGHMWVTKGIEIMLQSLPQLPARVTIDLYGPLDDYAASELLERGCGRINYRGVLTNEQVLAVLPDYHALVLPTFHDGEGYPGVVVEAFARGLPVIASRWRSIPEIVDESCGILIPPQSVEAFAGAVHALHEDEGLYRHLCQGAIARSEQFGDAYWTGRFVSLCV
jgi:glycosyltransferase involved in cell wall biosynthesis